MAPGVEDVRAKQLATSFSRPIWDTRRAWGDALTWRGLSKRLMHLGKSLETDIEPRCSLDVSHLRRSTIDSYDRIAEQFAEQWFDHPPEPELELFLRKLRRKSRVLDAGSGPGHHARKLSAAGHDVAAIDLSDGMLEQARKRIHGVRLMKMNIEALPFAEATFDAIWCAAAIMHVPREYVARTLKGFCRVLKPGGILGLNFQVDRVSEVVDRRLDHRFFEYYPSTSEVADLLQLAGFSVEATLDGQTKRNTHDLDIMLKWSTLYARRNREPQMHTRCRAAHVSAFVRNQPL
jgi:ubiquinone/menaquinone biosynthesis C-methylase UbiE